MFSISEFQDGANHLNETPTFTEVRTMT